MPVAVSVVIPTYRRDHLLERCLAAVAGQDLPRECYEVIVSDNAGSSETERLVQRWSRSEGPCIRYLSAADSPGPAAARNEGWRAARGGIIAFTDDDCIPAPSWLRMGLAGFYDGVAGVWGQVIVPIPANQPTDYQLDAAKLERAEFVNANCFYRREILEAVGGFDEQFETAWREDSDLFFRVLESGSRLERVSDAIVVHPPRRARWGISVLQQRKCMFNALLYKKHPGLYRERIQSNPPWRYYLSVGALATALAALAFGAPLLVVAGLGVWGAVTLQFSAMRLAHTSHSASHVLEMLVTSALIPPIAVFWRLWGALRFRVWFM